MLQVPVNKCRFKNSSLPRDARTVKAVHSSLRLVEKISLMSLIRLFGTISATTVSTRKRHPPRSSSRSRHHLHTISLAAQEKTCFSLIRRISSIRLLQLMRLFLRSMSRWHSVRQSRSTSFTNPLIKDTFAPTSLKTSMLMCTRQGISKVSTLATQNYWRSE